MTLRAAVPSSSPPPPPPLSEGPALLFTFRFVSFRFAFRRRCRAAAARREETVAGRSGGRQSSCAPPRSRTTPLDDAATTEADAGESPLLCCFFGFVDGCSRVATASWFFFVAFPFVERLVVVECVCVWAGVSERLFSECVSLASAVSLVAFRASWVCCFGVLFLGFFFRWLGRRVSSASWRSVFHFPIGRFGLVWRVPERAPPRPASTFSGAARRVFHRRPFRRRRRR